MIEQSFVNFLFSTPSVLVAPAGYGKTHSIAKSVKLLKDKGVGKILVLTHTNAGISSIIEKLKKEDVNPKNVSVFTISGFLQKIVHSLSKEIVHQGENTKDFYNKLYEISLELFKHNQILRFVIENSYEHIFVDEFQDCNRFQFKIVKELFKWNVHVHILLDPLQTIFNFEKDHPNYIKLEKRIQEKYQNHIFRLETPYRWKLEKSPLEKHVAKWRDIILEAINLKNLSIDLTKLDGVDYKCVEFGEAISTLNSIISTTDNVLVLHSNSGVHNLKERGKICALSSYRLRLIESIDNSSFYDLANKIDDLISKDDKVELIVYLIMIEVCVSQTNLEKWIKFDRLIQKRSLEEKEKSSMLHEAVSIPIKKKAIIEALNVLTNTIKLKVQRIELLNEIKSAIMSSAFSGKSIKDEITARRNLARVQGRKLYGKVIGTTLLTKGLEAHTVILLKPSDLLQNKNGLGHLYVALTRAVHKIILIDYP